MKKRLTTLGVAAGLMGGMAVQAGDVRWSVSIGFGTGGAGVSVGVARPQPVVVVPPICAPPVVIRHAPPVRVVVPSPVVYMPPRVMVAHPCPPTHRVVVRHRPFWRPPVIVVPARHHGHGVWKKPHRHGHR